MFPVVYWAKVSKLAVAKHLTSEGFSMFPVVYWAKVSEPAALSMFPVVYWAKVSELAALSMFPVVYFTGPRFPNQLDFSEGQLNANGL